MITPVFSNSNSRRFLAAMLCLLFTALQLSSSVSALSPAQKKLFDSGIRYFNIDACAPAGGGVEGSGSTNGNLCSCGGAGLSTASGGNNNEITYNFLREKGLSAMDAAAIVGNFIIESGDDPISPKGLNPTSGAFGIAQWLGGRLAGLHEYAKNKGLPADDLTLQLNYLWEADIPANEPGFHSLESLKAAPTIEAKAESWENTFERSGGKLIPERKTAAKRMLIELGSGGGSGSGGSGSLACGSDGNGELVGEYSLPVEKKYYVSNPEWFTKPHHDYPAADIPVGTGTKIFAIAGGKVSSMSNADSDTRGVHVEITAGDVVYKYFHGTPGSVKVSLGSQVKPGQLLMLTDNTGRSEGPHLHFQIDIKGVKHCPQKLLDAIGKGSNLPKLEDLPTSGCTN